MPAAWAKKDERQYKAILKSCRSSDRRRSPKTCKRIAAATVNKRRRVEGRTLSGVDPGLSKLQPGTWVALLVGLVAVGYAIGKSP